MSDTATTKSFWPRLATVRTLGRAVCLLFIASVLIFFCDPHRYEFGSTNYLESSDFVVKYLTVATPIFIVGFITYLLLRWGNNIFRAIRNIHRVPCLDRLWLRWCVTAFALGAIFYFLLDKRYLTYMKHAYAIFGVLLCLYFAQMLLFRLQCGLLEFLVMSIAFGLFEGLLLTTPGITEIALYLSPLVGGWILYGAVSGIVRAELMALPGEPSRRARLLQMAGAWLGIAAPAMLLLGGVIRILAWKEFMLIPELLTWSWVLLVFGLAGLVGDLWIGQRVMRLAKKLVKTARPAAALPAGPVAEEFSAS